jgi:NADH-quinone oxidoreductase subunit N
MNLGAFWVVAVVSDLRGNEDVESFRGLGWHMPVLGVTMGVFLFSLTGIPMFSGFIGKFLLFGAILKVPGLLWLALVGVLNSVVSFFYYAKVLKAMWLDKPLPGDGVLTLSAYHAVPLVALAIPTVVLGLWFGPVLEFARTSLATLIH